MHLVQQYNDHACFGACLESFFLDLGQDFSHKEFIKNNLDLFNGGTKIEGACFTDNFPKVAEKIGLKYEKILSLRLSFNSKKETIFFSVFWNDSKSEKHCVRFSPREKNVIKVMNPANPNSLDSISKYWIKSIHKFTKP
ncbi:hypothetical protein IH970_11405 [candidate division KSB1 bacterium]|nr:hypothetical protein [candidate division KSB1 bacterium]